MLILEQNNNEKKTTATDIPETTNHHHNDNHSEREKESERDKKGPHTEAIMFQMLFIVETKTVKLFVGTIFNDNKTIIILLVTILIFPEDGHYCIFNSSIHDICHHLSS